MKKFAVKSILFLIPIFILAFIFEDGLAGIPNSYNKKRTDLEEQLGSIEVLILGNSRSLYGINPASFKYKGFNLSNISQTIFYNKELGIRYIPKMPKLKCVIIEVAIQSFGVELFDGIEHWRDFYYSQFWGINYPENKWYEIRRYSKFFLYQPLRSIYYATKGFRVDIAPRLYPNGWEFVDSNKSPELINDITGKERANFNNNIFKENRYYQNIADLDELVSTIKKYNVQCAIISSPVYRTYSKYMDKIKVECGLAAVYKICAKYNCSYYNYLDDSRFCIYDYADNDHLSFIGAKKYSKIINDEIVEKYCTKQN